jgi:hypothetical protein
MLDTTRVWVGASRLLTRPVRHYWDTPWANQALCIGVVNEFDHPFDDPTAIRRGAKRSYLWGECGKATQKSAHIASIDAASQCTRITRLQVQVEFIAAGQPAFRRDSHFVWTLRDGDSHDFTVPNLSHAIPIDVNDPFGEGSDELATSCDLKCRRIALHAGITHDSMFSFLPHVHLSSW